MFKSVLRAQYLIPPQRRHWTLTPSVASAISRKMGSAELLTGKSSAMNNPKSVLGVNFFRDPLHLRVQF